MKKNNFSISGVMQSVILLLIIAATIGCNSKSDLGKSDLETGRPAVIKHDTVQVLALYRSAYKDEVKFGIIQRVTVDSFMYVDVDSVTRVKKWDKDTSYVVSYPKLVDSALSKQYHVPIKDSTGKQSIINLIVNQEKRFVRSGWQRADTITIKEMLNVK